jgi:hypothetical protein
MKVGAKRARKAAWPPKEVWLVFVDHSVLGVWKTRSEAVAAINLRRRDSLLEVAYRLQGYRAKGVRR